MIVEAVLNPNEFPKEYSSSVYPSWVAAKLREQGVKFKKDKHIYLTSQDVLGNIETPWTIREDQETKINYIWQGEDD